MSTENINDNPWHIQSIYDFQYFICPCCIFKNHSKQEFINHAYETHPDSIVHLLNIKDNSLSDIIFPNDIIKQEPIWDEPYEVSLEPKLEQNEIKMEENFDELNPMIEIKSENFDIEEQSNQNQIVIVKQEIAPKKRKKYPIEFKIEVAEYAIKTNNTAAARYDFT